jgi:hypothetical protein
MTYTYSACKLFDRLGLRFEGRVRLVIVQNISKMPKKSSSKGCPGKSSSKVPTSSQSTTTSRSVDLCVSYVKNTAWKVATDNGIDPQHVLSSAARVYEPVTHTVSAPSPQPVYHKLHLPGMEKIDVYIAERPLP